MSTRYGWSNISKIDFPYQTVIVDVSGTIVDANLKFTKKIWVCMEYANILKYGIGYQDMILAFGGNRINKTLDEKGVREKDIKRFWDTWKRIPEYSPGDIRVFDDVVPALNTLTQMGVQLVIASRLFASNFDLVMDELGRKKCQAAKKGKILAENPRTSEERMRDDCMFHVLKRAIENTDPPRMYIDDSLDRFKIVKKLDSDVTCAGSCRGLFGKEQLKQAGSEKVFCDFEEIFDFGSERQ